MSSQKPSDNHSREQSEQWLIKLESEQVKGPYSTDAVCKMILEGIFTGQEQIARYPQGEWRSLSKQMEFYETLLESLENPVERDEIKSQKMEAETVIRVSPISKNLDTSNVNESVSEDANAKFSAELQKLLHPEEGIVVLKNENENTSENKNDRFAIKFQTLESKQEAQYQIEHDKIKEKRKQILKKLFPVLAAALILVTGTLFYYFSDTHETNASWSLIAPNFKKNQVIQR